VFTPKVLSLVGAALDCMKEGITVSPQIMIPLVCSDHEISFIVPIIRNAYALVCEQYSSVYGDQVDMYSYLINLHLTKLLWLISDRDTI